MFDDDEEEEYRPYAWQPAIGICAEVEAATCVKQSLYGNEISFLLAGVIAVKNAPKIDRDPF